MAVQGPTLRSHAVVKSAAGLFRVVSVVTALLVVVVFFGILVGGNQLPVFSGNGLGVALIWLLVGGTYAALLWAIADVFILLSDSDDELRRIAFAIHANPNGFNTSAPRVETGPSAVAPAPSPMSSQPKRSVGGDALKLFAAPDPTAAALGVVPARTRLVVLGENGQFSHVRLLDNTEGWLPTIALAPEA